MNNGSSQEKYIQGGYILLARSLIDSGIMQKPPLYLKLWVWMLEKAQFKMNAQLKRGQLKTSIKEMQEAMKWYVGYRKEMPSLKEIRTICNWLSRRSDEGHAKVTTTGTMIVTTKVTNGIIITICNYDKYQDSKNYEGNYEGNYESPATGIGGAKLNNKKNVKNVKNEKNTPPYPPGESQKFSQEITDFFHDHVKNIKERFGHKTGIDSYKIQTESLEAIYDLTTKHNVNLEYLKKLLNWGSQDSFWQNNLISIGPLAKVKDNGLLGFYNLEKKYKNREKSIKEQSSDEELYKYLVNSRAEYDALTDYQKEIERQNKDGEMPWEHPERKEFLKNKYGEEW